MSRLFPAALALATLALPGARAAADDCMCLGPETLFADEALGMGEGVIAGQGVAAEVLESPDDTIETVDPSVPTPEPVLLAAPSQRRGAPVAWCRSADDPRCQRDDAGETSHRSTLETAPLVALPSTPSIPSPGEERVHFSLEESRGPSGFALRLERPPRS